MSLNGLKFRCQLGRVLSAGSWGDCFLEIVSLGLCPLHPSAKPWVSGLILLTLLCLQSFLPTPSYESLCYMGPSWDGPHLKIRWWATLSPALPCKLIQSQVPRSGCGRLWAAIIWAATTCWCREVGENEASLYPRDCPLWHESREKVRRYIQVSYNIEWWEFHLNKEDSGGRTVCRHWKESKTVGIGVIGKGQKR